MKKDRLIRIGTALSLVMVLVSGCASTKIVEKWRDAAYTGRTSRILVLAVALERGPRSLMEEEFARKLKGRGVEPFIGTEVFPEEGLPSKEAVIAKAGELNTDAVLVVRILKKTVGESTTPVRRYAVSSGFATSWDGYMAGPTSMASYSDVGIRDVSYGFYYITIETTMFDMKTLNPLWSAYTSTKYDDHPLKEIGPFASTIIGELDKEKLLPRR